jgi:uncharacterized phage protein (TIGR01671 family)
MREIKFRAWDKKFKYFEYYQPLIFEWLMKHKNCLSETKDFVIMQYTGLRDKNGKEIYCSDIVKYYDSTTMWLTSKVIDTGACFAVVTDENPIPLYEFTNDYIYDGWKIQELEVIGNIWENGELLNNG